MLLYHSRKIQSVYATMLRLQPHVFMRTTSFSCMHFNSHAMHFPGKKRSSIQLTEFCSYFATFPNSRGTILKSQKDSHLRSCIQDEEGFNKGERKGNGEEGTWSVIIPTYNRLPILSKCLKAVEEQRNYSEWGINDYEIILVDDGSTDGTLSFLLNEDDVISTQDKEGCIISSKRFPHVKVVRQKRGGAARARNLGFLHSRGSVIVFIDSDLVVNPDFLKEHARVLYKCFQKDGDDSSFTYGCVINTNNFENPESEPFKLTDNSGAFFATGNVAISRRRLAQAANMLGEASEGGPFDSTFMEYGWEDLELGVRLKIGGARLKHAPGAVGYHWHLSFSYDQLATRIEQEKQRGRGAVHFYRKHPVYSVRYMIQMTPVHRMLWFVLTLGGLLNEKTLAPIITTLVASGRPRLAEALVSPLLNWYTVQATNEAIKQLK